MTRSNILFIMMDQLRWDGLSCSGDWARTPHVDRIAAEGVRFANCVTTSPVCIPARISLATGLYPHNTGVWANGAYDLPAQTPTWMQAIRGAGYRTSLFGKTHLHRHQGDFREREPLLHALGLDDVDEIGGPRASARVLSHMTARWQEKGLWDDYRADYRERFATKPHMVRPSPLPLEEYADVYVGRQAKRYLSTYERDQPWFCWVSFGGPHEPWDTPQPYAGLFDPARMPEAIARPADEGERPRGTLDRLLERWPAFSPEEIGAIRADYAANIALIDDQIGEILQAVEERGELDNTVILFTSDHGEMNGDYGLIYKENFLNGAVRVPLLLRTPQMIHSEEAGRVVHSPVEWFDIGPTLAQLAGAGMEHRQFAKSLLPALESPMADHRPFAISEYGGEIMLLSREWKMAVNGQGRPYLLFNVRDDPSELRNLAGQPEVAQVEEALSRQMFEHLVSTQVQRQG